MSSDLENNITYSEKDWSEVESKYNLLGKMQLVIREESTTSSNHQKQAITPWLSRAAIASILFFAVGNVPVHSFLQDGSNENLTSFSIMSDTHSSAESISQNTPNKQQPIQSKSISAAETVESASLSETTQLESSPIITSNFEQVEYIDAESSPEELELPTRAIETYEGHAIENNTSKWSTYHVKSYDNLTNIFHKLGYQSSLKSVLKNKSIAKELESLKQDSIVRATSENTNQLSTLVFTNDKEESYLVTLNESGEYTGNWKKNLFEVRQARASFTIRNGLFFDGRKSGVADSVIKQIVKVFDWDIDFSHDVRVDDKVTAVYEEIYHDGSKVGDQNLLAAEFTNKGRVFRAIQYTYEDGKTDYFTPEGREMKKAFIRTPIAHARVSSHFNPGRFHPKLHKIRAHKGTDFAGRRGTKIMATGNGVIKSLGRKGGYGRTIVIKHKDSYTTLYAHMSRYKKGLKVGSKVYQGDVIGYVGSSGLATGPHLHYEFKKNGKAMDSMSASLPHSMSLSSGELQDFRNKAINLVLQLNVLHRFVKAKIDISSNIGG